MYGRLRKRQSNNIFVFLANNLILIRLKINIWMSRFMMSSLQKNFLDYQIFHLIKKDETGSSNFGPRLAWSNISQDNISKTSILWIVNSERYLKYH